MEVRIVAHQQNNALIASGEPAALAAVEVIVSQLDEPGPNGGIGGNLPTSTKIFSLAHSKAQDIVSVVEKLVAVKVAAYQPSNVVIANSDAETLALVEAIVSRLDQPVTNHNVPGAEQTP